MRHCLIKREDNKRKEKKREEMERKEKKKHWYKYLVGYFALKNSNKNCLLSHGFHI